MTKEEIKKRILKRFKRKLTGRIRITMGRKKLQIEYMFGGKYCLKRFKNGNETIIEMLGDVDKIAELIIKERTKIY